MKTKEEQIIILNKIYKEIMQLEFSHNFLYSIFFGLNNNKYHFLYYALLSSFAANAYTTINAFFTSGNYSFKQLEYNNNIKNEIHNSYNEINKVIPNFKNKRDKIFCHFTISKTNKDIVEIFEKFDKIRDIIYKLLNRLYKILNINNEELVTYSNEDFLKLHNELTELSAIINYGMSELDKEKLEEIINKYN